MAKRIIPADIDRSDLLTPEQERAELRHLSPAARTWLEAPENAHVFQPMINVAHLIRISPASRTEIAEAIRLQLRQHIRKLKGAA